MVAMTAYRRVVVGTDGSALAAPTVARAAFIAANEGSDLYIVCAWSHVSPRQDARNVATLGGSVAVGQVPGRAAASAVLAEAMATAGGLGATVASAVLVDGEAAAALLEVAKREDADLIVLGARSKIGLAERLLGDVASEVVRKAGCDVLIVRPPADWGDLEVPEDSETTAEQAASG